MSSYIAPIIWTLLLLLLSPFFHGFLGISLVAISAIVISRGNGSYIYLLSLFVLSIFNDVIFQTYLGATFLAVSGLVLLDTLFKRIFPHETRFLDFAVTSIIFVVYTGVWNGLSSLYAGNGFILFLNWDIFLSSLLTGILMSAITSMFFYVISYISGGASNHKIIRF